MYFLKVLNRGLGYDSLILSPSAPNMQNAAILWSPQKEQLSRALVGNLSLLFCPKRNRKDVVFSCTLHSAVAISSSLSREQGSKWAKYLVLLSLVHF